MKWVIMKMDKDIAKYVVGTESGDMMKIDHVGCESTESSSLAKFGVETI